MQEPMPSEEELIAQFIDVYSKQYGYTLTRKEALYKLECLEKIVRVAYRL